MVVAREVVNEDGNGMVVANDVVNEDGNDSGKWRSEQGRQW